MTKKTVLVVALFKKLLNRVMEKTQVITNQKKSKNRVWEVDFLRGFCMLFVIWDHLMFDFAYLFQFSTPLGNAISVFARSYWTSGIRNATHDYFVGAFVVVSGISCVFTRNDFRKSLKIFGAGLLITVVTNFMAQYMGKGIIINFGVLHMLGMCGFIWAMLKTFKCPNWLVAILAVVSLVFGYYYQNQNLVTYVGAMWLFDSFQAHAQWSPGDFFPLLPWLGWFFVGVLIGNIFYKNKQTKLGFINEKVVSPITFVGRHSLLFYLLGQVLGIGLLFGLSTLGWL